MSGVLALLVLLVVTAGVLHRSGAVGDRMALLAATPPVALGGLSIASFGLLLVDVRPGPWTLAPVLAGLLLLVAAAARRYRAVPPIDGRAREGRAALPHAPPADGWGDDSAAIVAGLPAAAWVVIGVSVAFLLWAGVRWIGSWPHGAADAVNIWTSRALLLARADGDIPLRLGLIRGGHPDYPLLLPASLAALYRAGSGEALVVAQAVSVLWLMTTSAAVFVLARRWTSASIGVLAAATVAVNPLMVRWAFLPVAYVATARLFLLATGGTLALLDGDEAPFSPLLCGFFAGALPWTKNEGAALALVSLAAVGLAAWWLQPSRGGAWRRLPPARTIGYFVAGAVPALAALSLFRLVWLRGIEVPAFFGPDGWAKLGDPGRWRLVASTAASESLFAGQMQVSGVLALLLLLAVVARLLGRCAMPPPAAVAMLAAVLAMVPIYGLAYVLSPYALPWHVATSVDRLLLQLMPMIVVVAALVFSARGPAASADGGDGMAAPRRGGAGPGDAAPSP